MSRCQEFLRISHFQLIWRIIKIYSSESWREHWSRRWSFWSYPRTAHRLLHDWLAQLSSLFRFRSLRSVKPVSPKSEFNYQTTILITRATASGIFHSSKRYRTHTQRLQTVISACVILCWSQKFLSENRRVTEDHRLEIFWKWTSDPWS